MNLASHQWISALALVLVVGCLWAEAKKSEALSGLFKTLASSAFLWAALDAGAWDSGYGKWVLAALIGSWIGDVFLISHRPGFFLAGLVAFLLAHVAYVGAFQQIGMEAKWVIIAGGALLLAVGLVGRWLLPHVPPDMKAAVIIYMLVITAMVACSVGAAVRYEHAIFPVAAVIFYASDLAVARNRFVAPGISNRLWGLPAYYIAQILFIHSVVWLHSGSLS